MNKKLPYKDNQFEYGLCKSVVPYLKDLEFSIKEMSRVCKRLKISFPHFSGSIPNQLDYGKVIYLGFSINTLLRFNPKKIKIITYFKLSFSINPNKRWQMYMGLIWQNFFSGFVRCRQLWLEI